MSQEGFEMKQVTGIIKSVDLEHGQAMHKPVDSRSYGITLRLDPEYQKYYGIDRSFEFFGNDEKRQALLQVDLHEGEHVALTINNSGVLMEARKL
jgi:hypothetical protein